VTLPDGTQKKTIVGDDGRWSVTCRALKKGQKVSAVATRYGNTSDKATATVAAGIAPAPTPPKPLKTGDEALLALPLGLSALAMLLLLAAAKRRRKDEEAAEAAIEQVL
jgi:hypothetical protein